jgi:serine/threonine-protein kinase SRPK3
LAIRAAAPFGHGQFGGISRISLVLGWALGRSKYFFDRHGDLKRIQRLKFLLLDRLLVEKYKFSENDTCEFAEFLCPIFDFAPEKRPTAQQCLQHSWLNLRNSTQDKMKKEANMGKLNVGIGNLKIKVGK